MKILNLFMVKFLNYRWFLIAILVGMSGNIFGQDVPSGIKIKELLRDEQLRGNIAPSSYGVSNVDLNIIDSTVIQRYKNVFPTTLYRSNFLKGTEISLLPLEFESRFNSHHPFGFNDGAMIPAKGLQIFATAGIALKLGWLDVQFKPEWVWASNSNFESYGDNRNDAELSSYYYFYNYIDMPEKFGNGAYKKFFPGQSYVKLNLGPVSVGYSTENLKWGPGRFNALILGNNAPGFKHVTVSTNRPIRTYIGAFEAEILGGRLDNSKFSPLVKIKNSGGGLLFNGYVSEWRYLSALNINYQPKWIPNLYLGFTRSFMAFNTDVNRFGDYFPFLVKLQKFDTDQDQFDRDQRLSLYSRLIMPRSNAEVYFEYALNDNAYNFRDFLGSPDHGRAYLFGFSKLLPFKNSDGFISVNAEITQLSQSEDRLVRDAGSFYQHFQISQGYTHLGQSIGAGPGTGTNVQSLQVKWVNGIKSLGFIFQRLEQNADFYDQYVKDFKGMSRSWVDYGFGFTGQWDYKNFIFNAKIQGIQSLNYQWRLKDYDPNASYYIPHNDVFNFHGSLGLMYRF